MIFFYAIVNVVGIFMYIKGIQNNVYYKGLNENFPYSKKVQRRNTLSTDIKKFFSTNNINTSSIRANFLPISFKGNAPQIKKAFIITGEKEDLPLLVTKKNDSYVVEFDSQTELIYGIDAVKYLDSNTDFHYDTQVIFPKKAEGVIHIGDKDINLPENSAVLINAGTKASIETKKGYPIAIITKKDFDWYERYSADSKDLGIRNKFLELMYYNSHLYNGEFTPNVLLSEGIKDEAFLASIGVDKYKSKNNLLYDIYAKKEMLDEDKRQEIELVKELLDKLYATEIIEKKDEGYIGFVKYCAPEYLLQMLKQFGFNEEEINKIMPIYKKARKVRLDARFSIKNRADNYPEYIVEKMKELGIIHDNKFDSSKFIYWKECYGNEESLRKRLSKNGFSEEEQAIIVKNWKDFNNSGFDISGLKFINENIAVYNLNDKLNNWTQEKTEWVTNSTAIASEEGNTPFIGVSIVQSDEEKVIPMSKIRKEEKLHAHPNLDDKRQTEIYLVTSGAAALNVVKDGKSCIKILEEGDLAIVGPGVAHCVNSILGEYEHIVTQVPSAFQYGFDFKSIVDEPEDYDAKLLEQKAIALLEGYKL